MSEDSQNVSYVYGFTRSCVAAEAASASTTASEGSARVLSGGIEEPHPPLFRQSGGVAAIVSQVSRSEFCGPAGETNLQDLAWLAARACRHQAVLEQVMRLGPVLPTRFGTLFSSSASLEGFMRQHEAAIAQFLERVGGQEEWAVKGFFDQARAEAEWLARRRSADPGLTASSPGMAYLQEQSLRIQAKEALDDRLAKACDDLLNELKPLASEIVPRRIVAQETPDAAREMVLNWALLVPAAAAEDFRGRIERANAEQNPAGLTLEVTGPWPPYSFCPVLEATSAATHEPASQHCVP
ncbi:MAG: GvpL/GvpF family gas vesicle protein [Verrucomicrobiota bacterium]